MTRQALDLVKTPTILFVEHDAPITPDCDFDWRGLTNVIMSGDANVIRFHHESHVLDVHEHLMCGGVEQIGGVPMRRTKQWSSRPHLASKSYYQRILDGYFTTDARAFIEDRMHGILDTEIDFDDITTWHNHRVWMYHPDGNIKRSYHLNGRGDDPKFDASQVF